MPMEDKNWLQYLFCSSCDENVSNENLDLEFAGVRNRSAVSGALREEDRFEF